MRERPNILFIVIDALRAKNLGCYGYTKSTSPNIDGLAEEGVLFEDAYACTNATDSSLTTIFSGRYPINHGIIRQGTQVKEEDLCKETQLLPEILKSYGYTTSAIDWLGRWHKRGYGFYSGILSKRSLISKLGLELEKLFRELHIGFLDFQNLRKFLYGFVGKTEYDNANAVTNVTLDIIKRHQDKRFFLFVHYWDTHFPYNPPIHYKNKYLDRESHHQNLHKILEQIGNIQRRSYVQLWTRKTTDVNHILAQYNGEIAFVDREIGRLIDALTEYGLSQETLIILTSDHGESLVEHGIYFDHHGLYDESIHVPLIFKHQELPRNKRIKGFNQHVDVVPTILEILKIPNNYRLDGKSLLPLIDGSTRQIRSIIYLEEAFAERKRAIRNRKYKYIQALSEEGSTCNYCKCVHGGAIEELYDLTEDPQETSNIIKKEPELANELRERLVKLVECLSHKKVDSEVKNVYDKEEEKEVLQRLKALGYF